MSHVSSIRLKIKDITALQLAVQKIGMQFHPEKKLYKAFLNGHGSCTHAISAINAPNADEIGVVKLDDETYELRVDSYQNRNVALEQIAGRDCSKLMEAYTQVVAIKEATKVAEAEGYIINIEEDATTGETVITLRSH